MTSLLIAEQEEGKIKPATLNALTCARECGEPVDVLIAGHSVQAIATLWQQQPFIQKIIVADHPCYEHPLAEVMAPLVRELGRNYTHIVAAATTFAKNFMPRVAAMLDVAQISDISRVIDAKTYERPIFAGNAVATVQSSDPIQVLTVRSTAFSKPSGPASQAPIETINFQHQAERVRYLREELTKSSRPELTAARVIVSGGRGLGSSENFKLLESLADQLNAAIGASRAAVDAGYVPNDYQVGQTGKMVAPELYIAIGISGAIQHIAGMKDSKVIVAINKDPDAPIFSIANYGLVGDLFTLIPQLTDELKHLAANQ